MYGDFEKTMQETDLNDSHSLLDDFCDAMLSHSILIGNKRLQKSQSALLERKWLSREVISSYYTSTIGESMIRKDGSISNC